MTGAVEPFRIAVPGAALADLRARLAATRWPRAGTAQTGPDWAEGVPLGYLRDLCEYWRTDYDWRAREQRLNRFDHVRTVIDGLGIHAVHQRSPHANALPLVLTHGWPGSFVEFDQVVDRLTRPEQYGRDPADAFHVVCPSLPGYGFSDVPTGPGWGVRRTAAAWSTLMRRLGYARFGAAGSDWGTTISTLLAQDDPGVVGLHVVPPLVAPDPATFGDLTPFEQKALDDLAAVSRDGSAYGALHATRPQTIGYGLDDSPAALCAWIVEKLHAWSDGDALSRDQMLDDVSLYWLTGTGSSSVRLYRESLDEVSRVMSGPVTDEVRTPTGCSVFPKENPRVSRRWAARRFTNILWWNEPPRGGHFAAWEQPEIFADELRSFFRLVRNGAAQ